jgi:hypothetical protein
VPSVTKESFLRDDAAQTREVGRTINININIPAFGFKKHSNGGI